MITAHYDSIEAWAREQSGDFDRSGPLGFNDDSPAAQDDFRKLIRVFYTGVPVNVQ